MAIKKEFIENLVKRNATVYAPKPKYAAWPNERSPVYPKRKLYPKAHMAYINAIEVKKSKYDDPTNGTIKSMIKHIIMERFLSLSLEIIFNYTTLYSLPNNPLGRTINTAAITKYIIANSISGM